MQSQVVELTHKLDAARRELESVRADGILNDPRFAELAWRLEADPPPLWEGWIIGLHAIAVYPPPKKKKSRNVVWPPRVSPGLPRNQLA